MLTQEQLKPLYEKFGQEKVDEMIKYLSYKKGAEPMNKTERNGAPILYVFRHGQTTDNADVVFSGWRDVDLTDKGVEQAEILAEKLKDIKVDRLFASDQLRAIRTMEIAMSKNPQARNLKIEQDKRIKERSYGDWQGRSKLEMLLENPESKEQRRNFDFVPPNGESIEMVRDRVNEFLDELLPKMREKKISVAIACHSNSIRAFRQRFEHLSDEEMSHIETALAQDYGAYYIE